MLSSGLSAGGGTEGVQPALRATGSVPGVSHAIAGLQATTASLDGLRSPDRLPAAARLALIAQLEDDARNGIASVMIDTERLPAHGLAGWPRFADEACRVFGALLETYGALSDLDGLPAELRAEVDVRLAGAAAQRLRWELQSCGPEHPDLWRRVGAVWLRSEGAGAPALECLRTFAYFSAGLDQLPPAALEAVDSLIGLAVPYLALAPSAEAAGRYVFLPGVGVPPRRFVRGEQPPEGALALLTEGAYAILAGLSGQVSHGVVPAGLGGGGVDAAHLSVALQVLLRQWSDAPPARRYRRHLLTGQLRAVRGFEPVRALLAGQQDSDGGAWQMQDASRGGIGALVPQGDHASIGTGDLVGLRAQEGDAWHLGLVRRKRQTGSGPFVGVETISQSPELVSADDGRAASEVLLCDPLLKGEAVRILTAPGALSGASALFINRQGSIHKLKPLEASASGSDFELRVYQVL